MFWIIGGDALGQALLKASGWSGAAALSAQLEHVEWQGFRFYDLIFPLFLFLVGCVLPFSLEKYRDRPAAVYGRLIRRTLLLFLLGLVCNGLLQFRFEELRVAGVLQRIAVCYGVAALIHLHSRWRGQLALLVLILAAYWAILAWVPVPGGTAGDLTPEGNLAGYVDRHYLPGKIMPEYYGYGDNEGFLSTLPAVATVLLGGLAGQFLRSGVCPHRKVAGLIVAGVACLTLGNIWGLVFPIIKILWTSSYVLVAGGWSLLLLALFYLVIDVWGWNRWAQIWTVIGANAITIYVAQRFIDFEKISQFFLGGVATWSGVWGIAVLAAGALTAKWLWLWSLYRRGVFLRV